MRYYGVYGTLRTHANGFYIAKAESKAKATAKLRRKTRHRGWFDEVWVQLAWVGIRSAVDKVKKGQDRYYTALGSDVFYFEE